MEITKPAIDNKILATLLFVLIHIQIKKKKFEKILSIKNQKINNKKGVIYYGQAH